MPSNPQDNCSWHLTPSSLNLVPSSDDERIAIKILADPKFDVGAILLRIVSLMVQQKDPLIADLIAKYDNQDNQLFDIEKLLKYLK